VVSLVPAIVIENKIKVMGRKPRKEEILLWIMEEINEKKS
jgi:predicted DsbA family dithiol-disulfide isomerase